MLNRPQDINFLTDIYKAIKDTKSDFKDYYDFWLSKGATAKDHQSLVQFANAGVKPANLDFILANLPQISDKLAFNYQMLMMRGANPQDQAKQEDLTLLVKFHASGCNNDQIKMMFELITNKHTNKELQQYFDKNQEQLKNDPKTFANIITPESQLSIFLQSLNAS
jgi:hypothetical protein